MHLHHDMHHAAYVKNLNAALDKHPELHKKSVEDLIRDLNAVPEDIRGAVRNNAGGHVNHTMFWTIMKPKGGGDPSGPIADVIKKTFGDFKTFQEKFNAAGVGQFGSGWVWLAGDAKGEVKIVSTPNQDNPISQGLYPIFGNDVWEHAYYLKYNNRRPEYLQAWWSVVNWEEINKRLSRTRYRVGEFSPIERGQEFSNNVACESRSEHRVSQSSFINCHPERSEGPAVRRKMQIVRWALGLLINSQILRRHPLPRILLLNLLHQIRFRQFLQHLVIHHQQLRPRPPRNLPQLCRRSMKRPKILLPVLFL